MSQSICQKVRAIRDYPLGLNHWYDSDVNCRSAPWIFLDCDTGNGGADRHCDNVSRFARLLSPSIDANSEIF
jgi:hypothetical protein